MTYKNTVIEKSFPSGMYSTFIEGHGYLKANTLEGIKELIREAKNMTWENHEKE